MDTTIRLQKYLAERGVASRRAAAELVRAGRVSINGKRITEPGQRIDPAAAGVVVDGRDVPMETETRHTLMLYKPRGYVCSRRGQGSRTVYELIPPDYATLVPVGRLDKDSEGLLILSNDGDRVHRLSHPRSGHDKVYRATVSGTVTEEILKALRRPIEIEGAVTRPARVTALRHGQKENRLVLEFALREGRKRQVRMLCARSNLRVHRLVRVRFGPYTLAGLKPGQWRAITNPQPD